MEKPQTAGWGEAVVEHLAADLRAEFPDMRGFSADNHWRMRQFFAEYSNVEFLEQAVQELADPRRRFLEQAVPEIISPIGAITHARREKCVSNTFKNPKTSQATRIP